MPSIAPLQPYDEAALSALDPDARLQTRMAGIYAHRPEFAQALGALSVACATGGTLEPRLVELVRLRIAFHNQCRSCMAIRYSDAIEDGLTEPLVCSLERPEEAPDLTAAERSALRFADLFANNHLAIDEGVLDDLRQHFDEGELVELSMLCARFVGFGRMAAIFSVHDDLPERFQADRGDAYTPWSGDGRGDVLVRAAPVAG